MTHPERDEEFGRLLRERADLKENLACVNSKLLRASSAFRMAAVALTTETQWSLEETEEGLPVPTMGESYPAKDHVLPKLSDLVRWLREKKATEARIEEINGLLPD